MPHVVFRSARDLITDGEWAKAQEKFEEYVTTYPNEKNIEAALYWLAYTQHKLAKYDQCRSTIDRLLQKYPNTTWREDARVLLAQVPGAYAIAATQTSRDDISDDRCDRHCTPMTGSAGLCCHGASRHQRCRQCRLPAQASWSSFSLEFRESAQFRSR